VIFLFQIDISNSGQLITGYSQKRTQTGKNMKTQTFFNRAINDNCIKFKLMHINLQCVDKPYDALYTDIVQ